MAIFDFSGISVELELDYDWKDADSTRAEGWICVAINDDDDENPTLDPKAVGALTEASKDYYAENVFCNRCVGFVVKEINGNKISDSRPIDAALDFLKSHPGTRIFKLKGNIE
jgi:hypothetical protein